MKKLLSFLCFFLLVINVNALADTTPPVIQDFNISASSISAPGKVKVSVKITDDISGVQWVKVFYYNPSKTQQLCANLSKKSDDVWEGYLEFNNYSESGTYTLWEIIAWDKAENQVDIFDNKLPSNYLSKIINVTNIGSDTTINESESQKDNNNKKEENELNNNNANNSNSISNDDDSIVTDDTIINDNSSKEIISKNEVQYNDKINRVDYKSQDKENYSNGLLIGLGISSIVIIGFFLKKLNFFRHIK